MMIIEIELDDFE